MSSPLNPPNNDCKFYGYKHYTDDGTHRCFYVGKGTIKRPYVMNGRNKKHRNVVNAHGCIVEVCVGPMRNEEVVVWEITEIAKEHTYHYDNPSGVGCNFTLGGEGTCGSHHNLGKKKPPFSDEHKRALKKARARQDMTKHSLAMIGKNKRPRPDVSKRNVLRKGQSNNCSRCGELGHNKRGCHV